MAIKTFKNHAPKIGERVYIDDTAVVIGQVTLADDVSVFPTVVIRGDENTITIGKGTNIQDGSVLHVNHANAANPTGDPLVLGEYVTVGHRAVLHACSIGNYCLIGINAVILDEVIVEDYVFIGANSLVPSGKHLLSGKLYFGNPVKEIRDLTVDEKKSLEYSARHYMKLKDAYLFPLLTRGVISEADGGDL
jgi:carbonic anhydrase/acetyltransferase-like protein (isoleucine patch superfamily)